NGVLDLTAHKENFELAQVIAERAVRLSPHDARAWLLLAWTSTASGRDIATLLKMSYYTGANELSIIAPRLLLIARRGVSDDLELAELLEGEVQKILSERPDLKPAIVAAYREASPATKVAIEQAVREGDPDFLNDLQSTVPSK